MAGLYIQLFSVHGLLRGSDLELGRDADTGGQVKYVLELARALGDCEGVEKVELFTRRISDKKVSPDYAQEIEPITDNVDIVRIRCGGGRYIRKEKLWPYLDEFADTVIKRTRANGRYPDILHAHYADAGYVAGCISSLLDVPMLFTGHSLGRSKLKRLKSFGLTEEKIDKDYNILRRVAAEEFALQHARTVIASTHQEVKEQYSTYENRNCPSFLVLPPGIDTETFFPYFSQREGVEEMQALLEARSTVLEELNRFLSDSEKPIILSLCRPDKRKNIPGLVEAYGQDKELQELANLAVFAGIRKDISTMEDNERKVLTELLLALDKYDLYGKMAIPKSHDFTYEVPELYRIVAQKKGVFVNPALTEPFGLTLIEASSCGCPFVAPDDGGPSDIVKNCESGILVNTLDSKEIAASIKSVLQNNELWYSLSQNGVEGVRKHYVWESHAQSIVDLIRTIKTESIEVSQSQEKPESIGARFNTCSKALISDIDNTLTGNDEALQQLHSLLEKNADDIVFGVATGRSLPLIEEIFSTHEIALPEIVIASVGTEIYYGPDMKLDSGYAAHISYRWDRSKISETLEKVDGLELQGPEGQGPFKVSFNVHKPEAVQAARAALGEAKCHHRLVFSHEKFLDVLPLRASKGNAVRYLTYKWDIPLDCVIVSGDSGNDREMLVGGTKGVVVGNHEECLEELRDHSAVYFASANYAAGVIEGMKHYGFL